MFSQIELSFPVTKTITVSARTTFGHGSTISDTFVGTLSLSAFPMSAMTYCCMTKIDSLKIEGRESHKFKQENSDMRGVFNHNVSEIVDYTLQIKGVPILLIPILLLFCTDLQKLNKDYLIAVQAKELW